MNIFKEYGFKNQKGIDNFEVDDFNFIDKKNFEIVFNNCFLKEE